MAEFANAANVSAGTKLIADSGFTCIDDKAELTVLADEHGELYVPCAHGKHYLDGQIDDGVYLGLSHAA